MREKRAGNFFKLNCREWSERKIFGKFCTFPPNSSKLRSDYLFSFQKRTNYLFPAFSRSEYLFPKSARPPSESNGRPLSLWYYIYSLIAINFGQLYSVLRQLPVFNGPDMSSVLACFLGQFKCYTKQVLFLPKYSGLYMREMCKTFLRKYKY